MAVLLAGLTVALDGGYPRWFGRIGAAGGGGLVLANGLAAYAGVGFAPVAGADFLPFVVTLPIEGPRLLALGILMWRRSRRMRSASGDAEGPRR